MIESVDSPPSLRSISPGIDTWLSRQISTSILRGFILSVAAKAVFSQHRKHFVFEEVNLCGSENKKPVLAKPKAGIESKSREYATPLPGISRLVARNRLTKRGTA
jgi:hypothetical protein